MFCKNSTVDDLYALGRKLQTAADAIYEVEKLREEVAYWRGEYDKLLSESLAHNQKMCASILVGLLQENIVPNKKD